MKTIRSIETSKSSTPIVPMKSKQQVTILLVALTGLITVASVNAASYTVYSSASSVALPISGNDVEFSMQKFNGSLGTLTGVTVSVVDSAISGSFSVTNSGLTAITVDGVTTDFRVKQATSLGYAQVFEEITSLVTTPASNPSPTLNPTETAQFNITDGQGYSIADQNISNSYFAAYTSADGAGSVAFNIRNRAIITTSGSVYTVNSTNTTTSTRMAITYTYTHPVPEPAAALLGGLGLLTLLRRRRR